MRLTDEQLRAIEQAKEAGATRVHFELTPEQQSDAARREADEEAGMADNIAYLRKRREAAREPGFSGDLRRAIAATQLPPQDVAVAAGINPQLVDRFCCAEADLPSTAIDRLADHLGLQLTPVDR